MRNAYSAMEVEELGTRGGLRGPFGSCLNPYEDAAAPDEPSDGEF